MKRHFIRLEYRTIEFEIRYTYDEDLPEVQIVEIELEGVNMLDFFDDGIEKIEKIILDKLIKESK